MDSQENTSQSNLKYLVFNICLGLAASFVLAGCHKGERFKCFAIEEYTLVDMWGYSETFYDTLETFDRVLRVRAFSTKEERCEEWVEERRQEDPDGTYFCSCEWVPE